ncbi:MAG: hypothetical protein ACREU2_16075 [Steroidobacteraceae bacterium]
MIVALVEVPGGQHLVRRILGSLREPDVQNAHVDLSSFVGPNANQTVQQMISQMVSANVTTVVSEPSQSAADAAQASRLAGFQVALPRARSDETALRVNGRRSFKIKIDRARLQSILQEAGRADLTLPSTIDGATMTVQLPRTVRARYGDCPQRASAAANIATPPPDSTQFSSCVLLVEGPQPRIQTPRGLRLAPLVEIGLEAVGMNAPQARQFLRLVNWQSLLGVAIPRSLRSYDTVQVNGVRGTLFNLAGRRGPTYILLWVKDGITYSLSGFGDPANAVHLANTLS